MRRSDYLGGRRRPSRSDTYQGRHRLADQLPTVPGEVGGDGRSRLRRPAAAVLLVSVGIGAVCLAVSSDAGRPATAGAADLTMSVRLPVDRQRDEVSRSNRRTAPQPPTPAQPSGFGSPAPGPSVRPSAGPPAVVRKTVSVPTPVGGLSQVQMNYAATIVRIGRELALPKQAYIIAVATALQESRLLNLANSGVSESLDLAHDGVGGDHDSVGLFQQRPSSGWGTVQELMTPATSARKFYQALMKIPGWQGMSVSQAAQAVQNSAFPDAYAAQEPLATRVVDALT